MLMQRFLSLVRQGLLVWGKMFSKAPYSHRKGRAELDDAEGRGAWTSFQEQRKQVGRPWCPDT